MYISTLDVVAITLALGLCTVLVLVTAYANRALLHENRNLRRRMRSKNEHCYNYHSPRPF